MIHSACIKRLALTGLPAVLLALSPTIPLAEAGESGGGAVGSVAENEIIRRLQKVEDAKLEIEEAQALVSDKDYEAARLKLLSALSKIPDAPLTRELRSSTIDLFSNVSVELGQQMGNEGRFTEAEDVLNNVFDYDPAHKGAKTWLTRLSDPDWFNQANSPEHVKNVAEVDRLLKVARGYYGLGDFNASEREYDKVLRIDPHNSAARRGQQEVEQARIKYLESARGHTRLRLLREVDEAWETPVPLINFETNRGSAFNEDGTAMIRKKLSEISLPRVSFDESTLSEALDYLSRQSKEYDQLEPGKGVQIILNNSVGPDGGPAGPEPTITLNLDTELPLAEVLRYVCELSGMKFRIEPHAVVVVPAWTAQSTEMFSRTLRVPPNFIDSAPSGEVGGGAAIDDPFAAPTGGGGGIRPRASAQEVLENAGVLFPAGASAFYNPSTSTLVVKNNQAGIELIEAYVEQLWDSQPQQVFIQTKFVEVTQQNLDELGFDWMLGQFNVPGSDRVFGGGGSVGSQRGGELISTDYTFVPPGGAATPVPTGRFPVTSGLRFGLNAIQSNAIDALINEQQITSNISPGIFGVGGVLTDPQFQMIIRALNQKKGTDLMTAPSVVTKSGQRAKIEIIREFIYPTEYDPPEIPQDFGSIGGFGGGGGNGFQGLGSANSFPVTPANPTAFEMRPVGVTMEVDPVVGPDGHTIELNLAPEVVEFEGFVNYGSPIQTSAVDALGQPTTVILTENRIEMPVFSTRKLTTAVTIWDGQTVAIGGLMREDVQHVEDKVPIFGDVPLVGRFFRTTSENHFKRNLIIFVKAQLIDPAGQPINPPSSGGAGSGGGSPAGGMGRGMVGAAGDGPSGSLFPPQ